MSLKLFMTETATTKRRGNPNAITGKTGAHATYLEGVKVVPRQLPSAKGEHGARQVANVKGVSSYSYETYTESHTHTKDSVSVTELPDIRENDLLILDGVTYVVKRAEFDTLTTAFGKTLYIYLDEDNA